MSLEVIQLSKKYGTQKALDKVSFVAEPGKILGFLGPNGAGKSTTMKIATGYLLPDEGDVKINGLSVIANAKKQSHLIGYLPEHNPLYTDMFVREFLSFIGGLYGIKNSILKEKTEEMLVSCGLESEAHKKIHQLSKGYRQRVGLAKALIHDPEVVILDEPTTGLDPNQLLEIRKLIKTVAANKTLILSTHIMQEVEALCDHVVIINKGKIVASDALHNLKAEEGGTLVQLETEEALEKSWFASLGNVRSIGNRNNALQIVSSEPDQARKEILKIIQEKNLNLLSLQIKEKTLESIFHQITQS